MFNVTALSAQTAASLAADPSPGFSQDVYVVPLKPGKNQVRYFDFQWLDYDYLDDDGSAGVRLYFYDRETEVARTAAGFVRQTWRYLSDRFQYKPSRKVPYVLYNSYREFLQTNVFAVEEGTLGVTSPEDLRMTLPYFGDRQLFLHTSTHEMVHQFMIQKVADRAASANVENPIGYFPLWFTEGIAEYYAYNQGIDADTDMFLRDLVLNQQGDIGYDIPSFVEDRPYSFLYTYKYGQARLAFLAETYGERTIQAVLDQSPRMTGNNRRGETREGFMQLLGRIAGEQPQQIDARWHSWLRKRTYSGYLGARQDLQDATDLKLADELDWMVATPDGNTLFYRGVERETGRAKLVLIDRRDPSSSHQLAIDQHPGTESLHPVLKSVMAVNNTGVAWFAQSGESDWLHYRPLVRKEYVDLDNHRPVVDLLLGKERTIDILRDGLIEAGDPTFSPDGTQLAFYGLDREGKIDIYLYDLRKTEKEDAHPVRITDDLYSERDLSWGDDGIVYASDATRERSLQSLSHRSDHGSSRAAHQRAGRSALPHRARGRRGGLRQRRRRQERSLVSPERPREAHHRFRHRHLPSRALAQRNVRRLFLWRALPAARDRKPRSALARRARCAAAGQQRLEADRLSQGENSRSFAAVRSAGDHPQLAARWRAGFDRRRGHRLRAGGPGRDRILRRARRPQPRRSVRGLRRLQPHRRARLLRRSQRAPGLGRRPSTAPFSKAATIASPAQPCAAAHPIPRAASAPLATSTIYRPNTARRDCSRIRSRSFSRVDATVRLQGVTRSLIDSGIVDINGYPTSLNTSEIGPHHRQQSQRRDLRRLWLGHHTICQAGSIGGNSATAELGAGVLPGLGSDALYWWGQLDGIQTVRLVGRAKVTGRAALGFAEGSRFGRHFFLSSFDNLRGFTFNDNRLLGDAYYVAQAELALPLDIFIRFAFFQNITGILGVDFGGVANSGTAQRDFPGYSLLHAAVARGLAKPQHGLGDRRELGPRPLRASRPVRSRNRHRRHPPRRRRRGKPNLGPQHLAALCILSR